MFVVTLVSKGVMKKQCELKLKSSYLRWEGKLNTLHQKVYPKLQMQ